MTILLLSLLGLIVPAQAIRIDRNGNEMTYGEKCRDDEIDPIVAPVLQDMKSFWRQQDFEVYPGAISMVGALRYGANSVVENGKRHIIDHDVDLLSVGPENSRLDHKKILDLYFKLNQYMSQKGWKGMSLKDVDTGSISEGAAFGALAVKKDIKDRQGNSYVMFGMNIQRPPNPMQAKFEATSIDRAVEVMKETNLNPMIQADQWDQIKTLWKDVGKLTTLKNEAQESKSLLHFDTVFKLGKQGAEMQPHPTKKVLFHGAEFRMPMSQSVLDNHLEMAFWYKKSGANNRAHEYGLCGFKTPGKYSGFEDDEADTPENAALVAKCGMMLAQSGYQSYHTMCQDKRPTTFMERLQQNLGMMV